MASHTQKVSLLLFLLLLIPFSDACGITVYWGQNGFEGSLQEACATNHYKYIAVAFLTTFGNDQTPILNLAGHCDPPSGTCTVFADQIRYCQNLGIKVLLSLGGAIGSYGISSTDDADQVAAYLWNSYLSGSAGPLGDAALDGVDFDIEGEVSTLHWDDLARSIAAYSTPQRKIYLSAAPQCLDLILETAIKTGLFDYVWVQFYNNPPCDYSGGAASLIASWNTWSSSLPSGSQLFLGLPAAPGAAWTGYVEAETVASDILPVIRNSGNYGGVMLWDRYNDFNTNYSQGIIAAVCPATTAGDLLISQVI